MYGFPIVASSLPELAASWLLTYWLHSSLLLGLVWLFWRLAPYRHLPAEEATWRIALAGGLLTATLQMGLAIEPLAGNWSLPSAVPETTASQPLAASVATAADSLPRPAGSTTKRVDDTAASSPLPARVAHAPGWSPRILRILTLCWAVGAILALSLLALSYRRLSLRLADRTPLTDGPLVRRLDRLGLRASTRAERLTRSGRITIPLALGIRRFEICLPGRVLTDLREERQEIVLAHELAHLERRDPAWLLAMRVLEGLLFLQPLNRIARIRLQEIAEYRCDDRAVELTGRPLTVARCLTDVAGWSVDRARSLPVPTMAVDRSRLGRRVARLLARDYPAPAGRTPAWLAGAALAVLALVAVAAPGVSASFGDSNSQRAPLVGFSWIGDTGGSQDTTPEADARAATPATAPEPPRAPSPPLPVIAVSPALDAPPAPIPNVGEPPAAPAPVAAPRPEINPGTAHHPTGPAGRRLDPEEEARLSEILDTIRPEIEDLELVLEEIERQIEVNAEAIEVDLESLELDLETLEAELEPLHLELEELSRAIEIDTENMEEMAVEIERLSREIEIPAEVEAEMERLEREMSELSEDSLDSAETRARLGELGRQMAELARPDAATMAQLEALSRKMAEQARPDPAAMERMRQISGRLAEAHRPTQEQMARYHAAVQPLLEELAVSAEQLSRIHVEAWRLAQQDSYSEDDLEELRAAARRARDEARERLREADPDPD